MKAVVMAGGVGSRLRPLTIGRPKPMVPLVNKAVLGHILDLLRNAGITEVIITLQHLASMIQDYFGDGKSLGLQITYAIEDIPLGTAGSVRNAKRYLTEPFLVISGDALTDFDLSGIISFHQANQAVATIALSKVPSPRDYGVIITDHEGLVTRFQEKPSWGEMVSDTANTGIYFLEPEVLDLIPPGQPYDWATQVFPTLLDKQAALFGYVAPGYWCDIGNFAEYHRATADFLNGRVVRQTPLGEHIGGDIWVGEGVDIAPDAQLFGPIYLGNEVQIKGGVVIRGPSVVRDYTIVDNRAYIDRSIVWRNCYIGEGAELRGAIVSRQCSLKSQVSLLEGTVIGEGSVVGEGTIVHPDVRLWPGKRIDRGAVVKTSVVWGSHSQRVLFGRYGITGLINFDLTPEFAARLGAAFGATLPRKSLVTINRDSHPGSRMLKRAVISGLPSAGIDVWDLGTLPIPVARFYTRNTKAAGGVHVRISPYDQRVADIRFIGSDGLSLSKEVERNIERVFFREDFRRAYLDDIGQIDYAREAIPLYIKRFLQAVDCDAIAAASFDIVVDYAYASTSQVLPEILRQLNVNTTPLGARVDATQISIKPELFQRGRQRLAAIVAALESNLGVRLDVSGEKVFISDDQGRLVPDAVVCAAMVELALRGSPGGTVAVPVNLSSTLDAIAQRYGGRIERTPVDFAALMAVARDTDVVMAADGTGIFIFPDFQPVPDGLMAVARMLQFLAQQQTSLSTVIDDLPQFFIASALVDCPWDFKGTVMRLLHERFAQANVQVIDGYKVFLDNQEWVLIRPDPDRPTFHVTAEAHSLARAEAIVAAHERLVLELCASHPDD